jgi:hypothetical protein
MFPGASLRTWMPAIRAGMTRITIFMFCGERKIMNHFLDESFELNHHYIGRWFDEHEFPN